MANEAKNDGIGKTLLVVLLLCLVCSVVVAGSAVGLKSKQQEQKLLDKQRNILDVAGLLQPKMESEQVKRLYSERIEPRLVDLNSGEFVAGKAAAFDLGAALRDDAKSVALPAGDDPAGIKRRSNQAEIYLVRDESGQVNKIVLPVYGTGLWSMMYAFVAWITTATRSRASPTTTRGKRRGWAVRSRTRPGASSGSASSCSTTTASRRSAW